MKKGFPADDLFYILKGDESLGPFNVNEILTRIEDGTFHYDDVCLRDGATECERLREVLDWENPMEPAEGKLDDDQISPSLEPGAILYQGHPSLLSYPLSFIGLVGGIIGGIWLYPVDIRLALLSAAAAILAGAYLSLMRFSNDYLISPRRIELISGVIAKSSNEIRVTDIRAINITCRGILGVIGIGTVEFFTAGDSPEISFRHIWAAKRVKELVRRLQDSPDQ